MRRVILVTLLAALTVLAGCQVPGIGGPDGDPDTDELGWENGYWYDSELSVTPNDGLNDSELNATVSRAMARVERVRGLEFEESVPVKVINRSTYRNETGGNHSEALEQFDNAKFEALFLVGEDEDSIGEQEENRGSTVAGYYSPGQDAIVIVSNAENPTLSDERTLAHELVHALQDQHFGLENSSANTRDAYAGRGGLVEGDASYTERQYMSNCGGTWSCLNASADDEQSGGGGDDIHLGLYVLQYFPYSEGPVFVDAVHDRGDWEAVNDAYDDVPESATEVLNPDRYPDWEPTNVSMGTVDGEWEQITPPDRPSYGVLGQSAITAGAAYTLYDDNTSTAVVAGREFLNLRPNGTVNMQHPFNYSIAVADGWSGGKFVAYEHDDELAYAWRTHWEDDEEASEFHGQWTNLIRYWGGERVAEDTYVIPEGEFADAFRITVDGSNVTVVNAPERSDLGDFGGV